MKETKKNSFYLIDGYALLYRSHFALIRNPLINSKGQHTSAVYGFTNTLLKLIKEESPDYIVAVFDGKEKTFRHEMYPEYKATREKMPDELRSQLPILWDLVDSLNIKSLLVNGFEADDIIGTLAIMGKKNNLDCRIISGDKDFMQLIDSDIKLHTPGKNGSSIIFGPNEVKKKWGVFPSKIVDLLGLMGDSSDNVPGVRGVGAKTAVKLLEKYGSFEKIIENANDVKNKKIRESLKNESKLAYLSKKLVTIKTDMKLDVDFDDMKLKTFNFKKVNDIFDELEFYKFKKELNILDLNKKKINKIEKSYLIVDNDSKLDSLVSQLNNSTLISIDLETTSVNPIEANIVGLSFSIKENSGWYVPILFPEKKKNIFSGQNDLNTVLSKLKHILESKKIHKCGQNIKYDLLIFKRHDINVTPISFDTMIASHLIKPEERTYKLDRLSQEYLNYEMMPISEVIGIGKDQKNMRDVELEKIKFYAVEDSDICLQLVNILSDKILNDNLYDFYKNIELPLIDVLTEMELNGVFIDKEMMINMSLWMQNKLLSLSKEIFKISGKEFNINSPKQLSEILFDEIGLKQVKKRSTDVTVLEFLKNIHPLPKKILEYRTIQKLKSTYIDTLPELINDKTGRIHTSFSQTITSTGRLSSSNPNFQNIPIRTSDGKEIRNAFVPEKKGWKIFSADYSQVELRIMAHLSKDKNLINAFINNEDIHARTSSNLFNVPIQDVSTDMRRTAKIVNFGVMYGAGPYRLSQELGIPMVESKKIITSYFNRYSGIKDYIENTIDFAKKNKYVKTILGRRRYCYDILNKNQRIRSAVERAAINMPIQGTAAELIKIAMISIHKNIISNNLKSKMILQVHDELIFETPQEEVDQLKKMVLYEMENAMKLNVPLVVDYGIGDSWLSAH
tara:strand:+ start:13418 stop:16129 length:2712 start_codon:yes stop_codon:yes gene_type:complete